MSRGVQAKNEVSSSGRRRVQRAAKLLVTVCFLGILANVYYNFFVRSEEKMDFRVYYVAAQMLRQGDGALLYDPQLPEAFHLRYFHSAGQFFLAPPVAALLYWPTALLDPAHGYLLWTMLSMGLLWASAVLINRALHLYPDSFGLVVLFYLFLPVHFTLAQGQIDTVVLLAYSLTFYATAAGQDESAGLALALGLVKFQLVLPFLLVLLFRRRWRVVAGFGLGAALFSLACIAISGPHVFASYVSLMQQLKTGPSSGMEPRQMANLRGLSVLLVHRELGKLISACVGMVLAFLVARRWDSTEKGFSAAIVVTLLVSYYLNPHSLILLLIPFVVAWKRFRWTSPTSFAFLLMALPILPVLALHWRMFALMAIPMIAFLACLLYESVPEKKRGDLAIAPADLP